MKKYLYQCHLLTDVVISSSGGTEGYNESLDYIPGSKFLGIVSNKLYDEANEEKTLDLFHNGCVKFGDASISISGKTFLKIPFSWFHKKGESLGSEIYIHHLISATEHENLRNKKEQLKQARQGYFSTELKQTLAIEQDFSIKSAHDKEKRKSKDSQMYGYYSLKKGSTWIFAVEDGKGIYADEIKSVLEGKHRVGRSRSAEYGLVQIEFIKELSSFAPTVFENKIVLFAQSNLCFYRDGKTTAQPTAEQLSGTENAEIIWKECQVRARNYKTWNRYRNHKDAERMIIEKGSVFIVQLNEKVNSEYFDKGIGSHKNEGFGSVLINPSFLSSNSNKLSFSIEKIKLEHKQYYAVETGEKDKAIFTCLKSRNIETSFDAEIDKLVNTFKEKYETDFKGIANSQWGTLRNYAKNADDIETFKTLVFKKPDFGILYRGQSEPDWRAKDRRGKLETFLNSLDKETEYLPFIVKLSSIMAKTK